MELNQRRMRAPAPLAPVAVALMAGIAAGRYVDVPAAAWLVCALGAMGVCGAVIKRAHLAPVAKVALAVGIGLTGAAAGSVAWRQVEANHIAAFVQSDRPHAATVTGRIVSAVEMGRGEPPAEFQAYPRPTTTRFMMECESVSTLEGPAECTGKVRVAVDGMAPQLALGRRVRISGLLKRIGSPSNQGQYDPRGRGRLDGIVVHLTTSHRSEATVLDSAPSGFIQMLWRLRAVAGQRLGGAEPQSRLLLRALILGDRASRLRPLQASMVRSGVAHFMSISGMHLGILLGFVYLLLRAGQISPRSGAIIVLGLLGLYLLIIEPRTPVLRGALMAAAFCWAIILGRSASTANLLAAAAIILLVADPNELFRPGFQLSFGIVAGILLLLNPVRRFLFGRWLTRRELMVFGNGDDDGVGERLRRRWWRSGLPFVANLFSVSVAAYLAAMPLVAYHFKVITPLAPIASLLLLPIAAVTLIVGYLHLVLTWWMPNLAAMVAGGVADVVDLFAVTAGWLGRIPACIDIAPIEPWVATGMAVLTVAVVHHRRLRLSRAWAAVVLLAGATALAAATQIPAPAGQATLTVLNVGNGMCAVLRTPAGSTFLFDAGSRSLADPYRQAVGPYLRTSGVEPPAATFISHDELDHFNALPALGDEFGCPVVFTNDRFARGRDPSDYAPRLLKRFERWGTDRRLLHRGQVVRLDAATTVTCLWPPPRGERFNNLSANDASLVLRLDCDGVRILLPGDIQALTQTLLLELPPDDIAADVLVLPHHGSYTPVLETFIDRVNPDLIIRSSGYRRTGAAEQIGPLSIHRNFAATNLHGAVTVTVDQGRFGFETFRRWP